MSSNSVQQVAGRTPSNIILNLARAARNMIQYNKNHTLLVLRTIERKIPNWRRTLNRNSELYRVLRNIDASLFTVGNNNRLNGMHGLYINTNRVKLPANRPIDPISLHRFRKGDVATRIRQGANFYFKTGDFNRWFGHNWKTMHPNSNTKISNKKNPATGLHVSRRNVSRVKFT